MRRRGGDKMGLTIFFDFKSSRNARDVVYRSEYVNG